LDFQTYVFTDGINTSENRNSYNQVQFSATISNRCSTEVLTICKCIVSGRCHGIH
jgi:hypothetical protein